MKDAIETRWYIYVCVCLSFKTFKLQFCFVLLLICCSYCFSLARFNCCCYSNAITLYTFACFIERLKWLVAAHFRLTRTISILCVTSWVRRVAIMPPTLGATIRFPKASSTIFANTISRRQTSTGPSYSSLCSSPWSVMPSNSSFAK